MSDDPTTGNVFPESRYRVQRTNLSWSEWRLIDVPIEERHILSLQINKYVTNEEYAEFVKQLEY